MNEHELQGYAEALSNLCDRTTKKKEDPKKAKAKETIPISKPR